MRRHVCNRVRFRFTGRSADGKTYYWESTESTAWDSRVEQIVCPVEWFWRVP